MKSAEVVEQQPIAAVPVQPRRKNKPGAGRPTVMTTDVLQKLLEARADGATDVQACLLAEISPGTYYKYCADNPEFVEQMARAAEILSVLAKRKLRQALEKFSMEEGVKLAWEIIRSEDAKRSPAALPPSQSPYRLSGGAVPAQVQINVGGQQIPLQQQVIRAEDLTDDEAERLARGEPIESVMQNRTFAQKTS